MRKSISFCPPAQKFELQDKLLGEKFNRCVAKGRLNCSPSKSRWHGYVETYLGHFSIFFIEGSAHGQIVKPLVRVTFDYVRHLRVWRVDIALFVKKKGENSFGVNADLGKQTAKVAPQNE